MKKSEIIEEWMLVWDYNKKESEAVKRFVMRKTPQGYFVALFDGTSVDEYMELDDCTTNVWDKAKPPPKKVTRKMTHKEIFELIQNEMRKGNVVLFKELTSDCVSNYWFSTLAPTQHRFSTNLGVSWNRLEIEVEE